MADQLVIYLDIDGVLNSGEFHEGIVNEYEFNPRRNVLESLQEQGLILISPLNKGDWVEVSKLEAFRDFVKKHKAKVIIVSAWLWMGVEQIQNFLEIDEIDVDSNNRYCDTKGRDRGERVTLHAKNEGFSNIMILDDSWRHEYHRQLWNLCVKVDGRLGLDNTAFSDMEKFVNVVK